MRKETTALGLLASEARTLCEAFNLTADRLTDNPALFMFGSEESWTWSEYSATVKRRAAGLSALGVRHGDTVGFLLSNRPAFNITDTAAMHLGVTCWSIYATSSVEQIVYMLRNANSRVLVTEQAFLERALAVRDQIKSLEHVIVVDGIVPQGCLSLEELDCLGTDEFDFEASWRAVKPDDVLCIIYSSGTTGPAKGIELTHHNMLSLIRAFDQIHPIASGGRCISFLPAAHVGDRWAGHYAAMTIGLTTYCLADMRNLFACTSVVHPTILGGVPRIWEKLKVSLEQMFVGEVDPARKNALRSAISTGLDFVRARRAGEEIQHVDRLNFQSNQQLFAPYRSMLGLDSVEAFMVGAAPMPVHVLDFFTVLGIDIAEMWGLTECTSIAAINPPGAAKAGTVGKMLPGMELRLADDGEIFLRGEQIMKGYRNEPTKTAEVIGENGWFCTGDIGALDDDGYLRIIGRKKELIINSGGKNMSPANIEEAIKGASPLIGHVVAIGDGRPYNIALIVLDADAISGRRHDEAEIQRDIAKAVERGNQRLARVEQIKRFCILPGDWEVGGEFLTPTAKLKRKVIIDYYVDEINALYDQV